MTTTESFSNYNHLEKKTTFELLQIINKEDKTVSLIIEKSLKEISALIDKVFEKMVDGGRLFYIGSGTPGRLGIVDASECPPTFGVDNNVIIGIIAGGDTAIRNSIEGAEDDVTDAVSQVENLEITKPDVVIGVAASGNTPFTCQVLASAKERGALTIAVSSNQAGRLIDIADHGLLTTTGAEVIAGSTRLGAGTAQKALLNVFSTALMSQLGRVLGNEMLCVQATNAKLKERQARILAGQIAGLDQSRAYQLLNELDWDLRTGLLVASGWDRKDARDALANERPFRELLGSG